MSEPDWGYHWRRRLETMTRAGLSVPDHGHVDLDEPMDVKEIAGQLADLWACVAALERKLRVVE